MNAPDIVCHRCRKRRGSFQPEDGDAARLFSVAAHATLVPVLCTSCVRTLEAMALRVAGLRMRASGQRSAGKVRP